MSHTKATVLLAGLAMGLGGTAIAQTQSSSLDQARAYAAETRSDAQRATLNQGGAGGPEVFGSVQFQYNVTIIDDSAGEDIATGFQLRRTRLGARGNVDSIKYYVQGNFSSDTGDFSLLDAYLTIPVPGMDDQATFTIGQFKLPFLFEENVKSTRQLGVDRSFVNDAFSQGRSQGIMFTYAGNEGDDYRIQVAFSDGFRTANTRFDDPMEADFSIGGRFDYKFSGAWQDFQGFTAMPTQDQALRVGGAIFFQSGDGTFATGTGATNDVDLLSFTVDGQWQQNGISVYGAFMLQDFDDGVTDDTSFGFLVQGGYRWSENDEVFARFEYIFEDNSAIEDFFALTLGYNHYVFGNHNAKFTADVFFIFETVNDTRFASGSPSKGLLPDAGDPQVGIRAQYQLAF